MTISPRKTPLQRLYEEDEHLWLERSIELLKENRLQELDVEHLIEELEELSRRDKNRVESFLRQIIVHLLLLQYWTEEYEYNHRHWKGEIATFRIQLNRLLTTNLSNHLQENLEEIYQESIFIFLQKTELGQDLIPPNCPYPLEQLLSKDWLPSTRTISEID